MITNLLVGFFVAPRGDRKRFDILTIISNVLQLTDEQKAQIGLSRPIHHANSDPTSPESQAHKEVIIYIFVLMRQCCSPSIFFFVFIVIHGRLDIIFIKGVKPLTS